MTPGGLVMTTFTGKQAGKLIELFADTSSDQVQAIYSSGLLTDLRDADVSKVDREEFRRVLGLKPLKRPLLDSCGIVVLHETIEPFVAKNYFVEGVIKTAGVPISSICENFVAWFLGKTEPPRSETALRYARLTDNSMDKRITTQLGVTAETTLADIFCLMRKGSRGEESILLTNGFANIFYVRDVNGDIRTVCLYWRVDGWVVKALPLGYPSSWLAGDLVFSRNS